MSVTVKGLSWGTYFLVVAYGSHWDIKRKIFRCNSSYAIFNSDDDFMPISSGTIYRLANDFIKAMEHLIKEQSQLMN